MVLPENIPKTILLVQKLPENNGLSSSNLPNAVSSRGKNQSANRVDMINTLKRTKNLVNNPLYKKHINNINYIPSVLVTRSCGAYVNPKILGISKSLLDNYQINKFIANTPTVIISQNTQIPRTN